VVALLTWERQREKTTRPCGGRPRSDLIQAHVPAHRRPTKTTSTKLMVLAAVLALAGGITAALSLSSSASARERLAGIYTGRERPNTSATSSGPMELGMRFTVSTPGSVVAIRYYRGWHDSPANAGALWTASGQRVATVTFGSAGNRGWQTARLNQPVALSAGVTYVASYQMSAGQYRVQTAAFAGGATLGNSTIQGTAGSYWSGSGFPSLSSGGTAYYVDVLFNPGGSGVPIPTPSTQSPTPTTSHPTPTPTPTTSHPTPTPTPTTSSTKPTTPPPPTSTPPTTPTTTAAPAECAQGGAYLWAHLESCGWPGPANTGPVSSQCPGGTLTVNSGSATRTIHVTSAGASVSCENITGCLSIEAPNVTVSNVRIACSSGTTGESANGTGVIKVQDGASATISHVAIDGMDGVHACIWHQGTAMTAVAVNCHGIDDGIFSWADSGYAATTGDHFTIKDSYFHDFTAKTSNGHIDGYQTEGAANGLINHNTYYMMSDNNNGTDSAIAIWDSLKNSHDITVSDNLIAGGGFSIYGEDYSPSESNPSGGFTVTNIAFTGNRFSTALFGCVGYFGVWFPRGAPTDGWRRSGNIVLETGADVDSSNPSYQGHSCN
jgi:hypothetical protein